MARVSPALAAGILGFILVLGPAGTPPIVADVVGVVEAPVGELTASSRQALARGLSWLDRHQGSDGNWESQELGLISMGILAFLADGHAPGRGPYGPTVERALDHVLTQANTSGLLNVATPQHDMYNHGLATFVLGQVYGQSDDPRVRDTFSRALQLIIDTQCDDGGWDYTAKHSPQGHDLSLAVMQAKALRSAVDSGFDVPQSTIELAIQSVRRHYTPAGQGRRAGVEDGPQPSGQFTYTPGGRPTLAMAAAGVVCLQEFGQYDDWRIAKNMQVIVAAIDELGGPRAGSGEMPFEAYTLYYLGQALYQVGGEDWRTRYPKLREYLVQSQIVDASNPDVDGMWRGSGYVSGSAGDLYATAVASFVLAIPNRYLPILQEGKIEGLRARFGAAAP